MKAFTTIKSLFIPFLFIVTLLAASACEGEGFRPTSVGLADEVFVVMDSTQWDSETALAIEETFGKGISTLPTFEPTYRLLFRDFNSNAQLEQIRKLKNVIIAAPIDQENNVGNLIRAILSDEVEQRVRAGDSFAFPLEDRWVRDQWTLILTSTTDDELADKIRNSEHSLVSNLMDREFERRISEIYRKGEQIAISDSLWDEYGWSLRMQHDYLWTTRDDNISIFRRVLPENDRWIMAWWQDDVPTADFIDPEWINATRDSLLQIHIRGEIDQDYYVTTEYRRDVITREIERDDRINAFETLGTWRMVNDAMGGPFVNFVYHDPQTERLFVIEYGQFAPSLPKRRFVRQFRSMGRTFESDSTWNTVQSSPVVER